MKRLRNWEARLVAYLRECRARPFAWGEFDCTLFACGAVDAVTGSALVERHRGQYVDEAGATNYLRGLGWSDLREATTAMVGPQLANPRFQQRGDVAWIPPNPTLGIGEVGVLAVIYEGIVAALPDAGLRTYLPAVGLNLGAVIFPVGRAG